MADDNVPVSEVEAEVRRRVSDVLAALGITPDTLRVLRKMSEDPGRLAGFESLVDNASTLQDLTLRAIRRRMNVDKVTVGVKKTGWTALEARIFGQYKSVRSALRAHENSIAPFEKAKEEYERTANEVVAARDGLNKFMTENGITLDDLNGFLSGRSGLIGATAEQALEEERDEATEATA